jgi:hypothetical protein
MSDLQYLTGRVVDYLLQGPDIFAPFGALPILSGGTVVETDLYAGPYPDEYSMEGYLSLSVVGGSLTNDDAIEWEYMVGGTIEAVGWVWGDAGNTVTSPVFTTDLVTPVAVAAGNTLRLPANALGVTMEADPSVTISSTVCEDFLGTLCGIASAFSGERWITLLDESGVEPANPRIRIDYWLDPFPNPADFETPPVGGISENISGFTFSENEYGNDVLIGANYKYLAIFDAVTLGTEMVRFELDRVYTSVDQGLITIAPNVIQFVGVIL